MKYITLTDLLVYLLDILVESSIEVIWVLPSIDLMLFSTITLFRD